MKVLIGLVIFVGICLLYPRFSSWVLIYFGAMTLLTYLIFAVDKIKAVKGWWRISESTLFFFAAIGGSIGMLVGELTFGHKRSKLSFNRVFYSVIVLQVLAILTLLAIKYGYLFPTR